MVAYFKRIYSVAEFRTGFVASSCALLGLSFGIYMTSSISIMPTLLILISSFCFNIVANIAAEISGFKNNEDTDYQTGHKGSEGLVRNEATIIDAWSALLLFSALAICSGLIATILTQKLILIGLGAIGFTIAILYSLTPLALNKYPISELTSGLMCGSFCFIAGALIYLPLSISLLVFSIIPLLMVSFLMAANNTTDYQKDLNVRTTFPHLIGFENSIKILCPLLIIVYLIWLYVSLSILDSRLIMVIGFITLTYFGLFKWYYPYSQVKIDTPDLSRIYGPLPLILLLPFNTIISLTLILGGL